MQFKADKQLMGTSYIYKSSPLLGEGSYSKVFLGYDLEKQKYVALKQINLDNALSMSAQYKNDFFKYYVQEITTLQSVKTNNIVKLIDMIATEQKMQHIPTFLIFEYCNGGSLQKQLNMHKTLSLHQSWKYFTDIVTGFKDLYQTKIIHRDIKPANILIHDDRALISDFGFARFLDKMNEADNYSLLGTSYYSCPQILSQEKYSSKCDIWSLGIVFYQMIYGHTPWSGQNLEQIYSNIIQIPLCFHDEQKFVPQRIKQIIAKMLEIEEDNRLSWEQLFEIDIIRHSQQIEKILKDSSPTNEQAFEQQIQLTFTQLNQMEQEEIKPSQ